MRKTIFRTALTLLAWMTGPMVAQAAPYPSSADIHYDVVWGLISLDAEQHWRIDGRRYTLSTELKLPLGFKDRRYLTQGQITEAGLEPARYEDVSDGTGKPSHQALFDRQAQELRYGAPDKLRTVRLEAATQDLNALTYQLAWWGPQGPSQWAITNGKGVVRYRFDAPQAARLSYRGQDIDTVHYRGSSPEGDIEVWLAPSLGGLPVQVVRAMDGRRLKFIAKRVAFVP